jgi:hypothetical protein
MPKYTVKKAQEVGDQIGADWSKYTAKDLLHGMQVEAEHKDVTHGDPTMTAKIAKAHLQESPRYYFYLKQVEKTMKKKLATSASAPRPVNSYITFCNEHRHQFKGFSFKEQSKALSELYKESKSN